MDGSGNALEIGVEKKKKIGVRNQVDEHETVGVDSLTYPVDRTVYTMMLMQ